MSLVATLMQPLRTAYTADSMDKNEIRPSRYGAWDFFQKQSNLPGGILTPDAKAFIKKSVGNTVNIPVLNAQDVTILNTRTCTIPADTETSALVTLTFVTYGFGFTMNPARFYNNDVNYQQLFNQKLKQYLLKFADTLDTASVNTLNTNKNVYYPGAITKYYPVVGNALQVGQDQKNDFFNQAQAILAEMDYYDTANIIGSTSLMPTIDRLKAQGTANAVNQSFQFDPYRWNFTNRLYNGSGIQSTLFSVPDGYVATENRNTPDNVMGSIIGSNDNPLYEWGEEEVPIVNLKMGTFYTQGCGDMTVLDGGGQRMSHLSRTKVEGFYWDTDVCFVTNYNSNPSGKYNPIVKAEISTTAAVNPTV